MSNKNVFNEDLFRTQLRQSLEEVQVSDALRNGTLDACRNFLETNPPADAPASRRLLPFAGRHATFFRVAGGLAAGVLLFLMILDVMPRTGSSSPAARSARGDNATMSMSAGASMEAATEAETAYGASAATANDTARSAEEPAVAESSVAAMDSEIVTFSESATDGADVAIKAAPQTAYLTGGSFWASYATGSPPQALVESPDIALVEAALTDMNTENGFPLIGHAVNAASGDEKIRILPVLHLAEPLSKESLVAAASYHQLLAQGTTSEDKQSDSSGETVWKGLWMLPVISADGAAMVPLRVMTDADDAPALVADMPLSVENRDAWLQLLSQDNLLQQSLSEACGSEVTTWQIIDVDAGRGFWVGWQADGTEWVMPFLDNPARMGLENGHAYSWEALVAIVEPLL